MVERAVRVDDPDLTPEGNRMLTRALREAVGSDGKSSPAECKHEVRQVPGSGHGTLAGVLAVHRVLIAITFVTLLVVGVIAALTTGSWWTVVAAAGVHALGTVIIVAMTLRLTTEVERLDPRTAARLEEQGVADPDRALSDLVEQFEEHVEPADDRLRADIERGSSTRAGARGLLAIGALVATAVVAGFTLVGLIAGYL